MRIDSQDRKRIDGQRSGTALAFSAMAPWERPAFAAHLILSHPQRLALWSVPTIVASCRHCGLEATDAQSRRSAVSISSLTNGAWGEHRQQGKIMAKVVAYDANPWVRLSNLPQFPAPVRGASATIQPVQRVKPSIPTDQLSFRTHERGDEILPWQINQSNREPMFGNGPRGRGNR